MNKKQQQNKERPPILIFILMTSTNILINLDHGILPACTDQMKKHYDMNQLQLGLLGSIVYFGIIIMGTFAGRLYQHINSKLLTLIALLALQTSLIFFVLSNKKWMAYVFRFITGGCQVFLLVYYPVWIDKFGQHLKTTWLTLLQICVPVGIFIGYGITSGVIALGFKYQYSFYIQIILVSLFVLGFAFISKQKLDSRRYQNEEYNQFFNNPLSINQNLINEPNQQKISLKKQQKKIKLNYFKMIKKLFKSKLYIVGIFSMSIILFVSTGVQFWLTDYFINVLHIERGIVNIAYAIVSITGPTSGCAFGGFFLNKKGGYENPKTVYYVLFFACVGITAAIIIPFINYFILAACLLWIVLFFGGAMMPGLTGIMMVSVPPYLRAFGNSNGEIIKNIAGYLPAPFMYGLFNSIFNNQRAGLKLIMFWGLWAPILLTYGSFHKYKELKRIKQLKQSLIDEQQTTDSIDKQFLYSTQKKQIQNQQKQQQKQ